MYEPLEHGVDLPAMEREVLAWAFKDTFPRYPAIALLPYLLVLLVIPLGPGDLVGQHLDSSLFFALAVPPVPAPPR